MVWQYNGFGAVIIRFHSNVFKDNTEILDNKTIKPQNYSWGGRERESAVQNRLQWFIAASAFSWQPPAHRLSTHWTKLLMQCSIDRVYPRNSSALYLSCFPSLTTTLVWQQCKRSVGLSSEVHRLTWRLWLAGCFVTCYASLELNKLEEFQSRGIYPLVDFGLWNQ